MIIVTNTNSFFFILVMMFFRLKLFPLFFQEATKVLIFEDIFVMRRFAKQKNPETRLPCLGISVGKRVSLHDSSCPTFEFLIRKNTDLSLDVSILGDQEECGDCLDAGSTITKRLLRFMPDGMMEERILKYGVRLLSICPLITTTGSRLVRKSWL